MMLQSDERQRVWFDNKIMHIGGEAMIVVGGWLIVNLVDGAVVGRTPLTH